MKVLSDTSLSVAQVSELEYLVFINKLFNRITEVPKPSGLQRLLGGGGKGESGLTDTSRTSGMPHGQDVSNKGARSGGWGIVRVRVWRVRVRRLLPWRSLS